MIDGEEATGIGNDCPEDSVSSASVPSEQTTLKFDKQKIVPVDHILFEFGDGDGVGGFDQRAVALGTGHLAVRTVAVVRTIRRRGILGDELEVDEKIRRDAWIGVRPPSPSRHSQCHAQELTP